MKFQLTDFEIKGSFVVKYLYLIQSLWCNAKSHKPNVTYLVLTKRFKTMVYKKVSKYITVI